MCKIDDIDEIDGIGWTDWIGRMGSTRRTGQMNKIKIKTR